MSQTRNACPFRRAKWFSKSRCHLSHLIQMVMDGFAPFVIITYMRNVLRHVFHRNHLSIGDNTSPIT